MDSDATPFFAIGNWAGSGNALLPLPNADGGAPKTAKHGTSSLRRTVSMDAWRSAGSVRSSHMYALDGATGAILWHFASGGSWLSGAAMSEGRLFWGSGYTLFGTPNNRLYSFGSPD